MGNGKEILIKKGILDDYAAIDLKAKIIKGSSQSAITNDSSTLEVTVPIPFTYHNMVIKTFKNILDAFITILIGGIR